MSFIRIHILGIALATCIAVSFGKAQGPFGLCKMLKQVFPGIKSGEYTVSGDAGLNIRVFCEYLASSGYTYLPKGHFIPFSSTNSDHVKVKHLRSNGIQYDVTLKQISSSLLRGEPLSIQSNSHIGYKRPVNHASLGPYIYLGFIPASIANSTTYQGYNANNRDFKFKNCDRNPNSYLAFYYNDKNNVPVGYYNRCCYTKLMREWIDQSKTTKFTLPWDYFFQTEMHMGGCGGYAVSGYKGQKDIVGAALGIPFGKYRYEL